MSKHSSKEAFTENLMRMRNDFGIGEERVLFLMALSVPLQSACGTPATCSRNSVDPESKSGCEETVPVNKRIQNNPTGSCRTASEVSCISA